MHPNMQAINEAEMIGWIISQRIAFKKRNITIVTLTERRAVATGKDGYHMMLPPT